MSRSPKAVALAVALVALAVGVPAADAGVGAGSRIQSTSASVLELTLPVLDLEFELASLDGSYQRVDTTASVRVTLSADVLFAFNRAQLSSRAAGRLREAVAEIRRAKPAAVTVAGHTDAKGSPAYNLALSRRRAVAVRAALARALGVEAPRLVATGRGERIPVARNVKRDGSDNPRGRALNRRVEIRIPKD